MPSRPLFRANRGSRALDDYYDGIEGAQRVIKELDELLQHVLDNLGQAETLDCSIQLRVAGGGIADLNKTYRPHIEG